MSSTSINSLYKQACEGLPVAERQLFELLSARFRLFVLHRIWNEQDGREIAQDALMVVFREYRKITVETSFSAWAYKVLQNRILAYLQKKKRETDRMEPLPETDTLAETGAEAPDPDLKRQLQRCLRKIGSSNSRYARILNLHQLGFGTDEICRRLEMKPNTFYSILSRARTMLEKCLESGETR